MEKIIFHTESNQTDGGFKTEEKTTPKQNLKNGKVLSNEVRDQNSASNADIKVITEDATTTGGRSQATDTNLFISAGETTDNNNSNTGNNDLKIDEDDPLEKIEKVENIIKYLTLSPELHRAFLMIIPDFNDENLAKYSIEAFKALEFNRNSIWKTQTAIAYEINARLSGLKSGGGRSSKGKGYLERFNEACAKLGMSGATQNDNLQIYNVFVIEPTLGEPDPEKRKIMQVDALEEMKLKQFFYKHAQRTKNPFKAIELAEKKIP